MWSQTMERFECGVKRMYRRETLQKERWFIRGIRMFKDPLTGLTCCLQWIHATFRLTGWCCFTLALKFNLLHKLDLWQHEKNTYLPWGVVVICFWPQVYSLIHLLHSSYTFLSLSVHLLLPPCTQITIWESLISSEADTGIWALKSFLETAGRLTPPVLGAVWARRFRSTTHTPLPLLAFMFVFLYWYIFLPLGTFLWLHPLESEEIYIQHICQKDLAVVEFFILQVWKIILPQTANVSTKGNRKSSRLLISLLINMSLCICHKLECVSELLVTSFSVEILQGMDEGMWLTSSNTLAEDLVCFYQPLCWTQFPL